MTTEYIVMLGPRTDDEGNQITVEVSIKKKIDADLTNHKFLLLNVHGKQPIEEWVPIKEYDLYHRATTKFDRL